MAKKSEYMIEKVLEGFQAGMTQAEVCEKCEINPVTLFRWRMNDPTLDDKIERAKASRIRMVEDALFKGAMKNNVAAQIFFLKNKAGYKDTLIDQSQNISISYVWNEEDSHTIQPTELPEGDTQLIEQV